MGQEIVYCFRCNLRLTGADFEHGKATHVSGNTCCVKCLTPPEREAFSRTREAQARKTSPGTSRKLHRDPTASTDSRPDIKAAPPELKKTSLVLAIGGIGGGVLLLVIILTVALSGGDDPRSLTVLEQPPYENEERRTSGYTKDLDSIRTELAGPLERGNFGVARAVIERARGRHPHPQWKLAIGDLEHDLTTRARSRLKVLIEKAALAADLEAYDEIRKMRSEVSGWGPAFDPLLKDFDRRFETILAKAPTKEISVTLLSPTPQAHLLAGEDLLFTVDVSGPVDRVEYLNGSTVLASVKVLPFDFTWRQCPAGLHTVTVTAYDSSGRHGETVRITVRVREKPVRAMLVERGAPWKYLDDGTDQGIAWREIRFDDKVWKQGRAELGYGDGDEQTKVSFGPDSKNKFITTYFRHAFEVDNPDAIPTMVLRLKRDDGAVVYLNGKEVVRSGMPGYAANYRTRALDSTDLESRYLEFQVEPTPLVRGSNLLAVEVHQRSGSSSDISFDLELEIGGVAKPTPEPPARDTDMKPDCEVLWQGTWYAAKILNMDGKERWYIHYIGDSSDDDEWIGKDRIRFFKAAAK